MTPPTEDGRRARARSFLLGGIVGASAVVAGLRRARRKRHTAAAAPSGLAAFEDAPCFRETVERNQAEGAS